MNRSFHSAAGVLLICLLAGMVPACTQPQGTTATPAVTFEPVLAYTASQLSPDASGGAAILNPMFDPQAPVGLLPQPPADPNAIVISFAWPGVGEVNGGPSNINFMNHMTRLSALLKDRGWNIRFVFDDVQKVTPSGLPFMSQYLSEKQLAGQPLADGYIVHMGCTQEALETGYATDLSKLIPMAAPVYYGRYGKLLEGKGAGLPISLCSGRDSKISLMVKEDTDSGLNAGIASVSDIFRLLDGNKHLQIYAKHWYIIDAWAFEQGYYPLSVFGMGEYLYAAYGDKDCTPVLLEQIKGFNGFAEEYRSLLQNEQIVDPVYKDYRKSNNALIGYINTLDSFTKAYNLYMPDRCVAYPLAPYLTRFTNEYPMYQYEMMVSATSKRAEDIIRFVEWINISQENYDLMNYGEPGVDYRLAGQRYEPLIGGEPVPTAQWNSAYSIKSFFAMGSSPFFNDTLARYHSNAPVNLEALMDKYNDMIPDLLKIEAFKNPANYLGRMPTQGTDISFGLFTKSRADLIIRMFDSREITTGTSLSELLKQLSLLDNQQVLNRYTIIINEIRNSAGK